MNTLLSHLYFSPQPDRELRQPVPPEDRGLIGAIKTFFRKCVVCAQCRSHSAKILLDSSLANLSSVTTPNGPWVYTVVPWED